MGLLGGMTVVLWAMASGTLSELPVSRVGGELQLGAELADFDELAVASDRLKEWLSEVLLRYPITKNPVINKTIADVSAVLSLKEIRINGVQLGRVDSHYVEPPGTHIGTAPFSFHALGLGSTIELEDFHLMAHAPLLGKIDAKGNLTLVLNDTEFATSLSVTKYDPMFPHMPAIDGAGSATNSSLVLHVSRLSAVDAPTSKFSLSDLLSNYTSKPDFYDNVNALLSAFIAPILNPDIDSKISSLFNTALASIDALIGNSIAPPVYLPQWPLPGTLNFKELASVTEKKYPVVASLAKERLATALVGLATTVINKRFPKIAKTFSVAKLAGKSLVLSLPKDVSMNFTITQVTVTGLGDVGTVLPLQPICQLPKAQRPAVCNGHDNNQTVRTSLGLKSLGLRIAGTFNISNAKQQLVSHEEVEIAIDISRPTLQIDTVIGIADFDAFPMMRLADRNCILAQLETLQVQSVSIDFDLDHMSVKTTSQGLRQDLDAMLSSFLTMLVDAYRGTFPNLLNNFIMTHEFQLLNANITTGINALVEQFLPILLANKKLKCEQVTPLIQPITPPRLVDWSNTSEFPLAKAVSTATGLLNNANIKNLNKIISLVTLRQSRTAGRIVIAKKLAGFKFNFPRTGKVNLDLTGIEIDHLNSLSSIKMLVPNFESQTTVGGEQRMAGGETLLDNELVFAPVCTNVHGNNVYGNARQPSSSSCGPLNITIKARLEFIGQRIDSGLTFADDISMTLSLSNISFATRLNVSIDSTVVKNLTLGALMHGKDWKIAHPATISRWGENVCVGDSITNLSIAANYDSTHGTGTANSPFSKWTQVSHLTFGDLRLSISDSGQPMGGKGSRLDQLMPRIAELEENFKRFTTKLLNFYGPYVVPQMLNPVLGALVTHTKNCTGRYPPPPTPAPRHKGIPTHGKIGPAATAGTSAALLVLLTVFAYVSRKEYVRRGGADDIGLHEGLLGEKDRYTANEGRHLEAGDKKGGAKTVVRRHVVRRVPAAEGGNGEEREGGVDVEEIESSAESWASGRSGTWVGEPGKDREQSQEIQTAPRPLLTDGEPSDFTAGGRWLHMAEDAPSFAWPCMLFHNGMSRRVRYGIFLTLVGVIILFVTTNASVWASVIVKIIFEGNEIELPPVFSFTLKSTVHDMWKAKVYPLALIIAVFSGAWPYAKVLLMMFCWVCPVWVLPPRQRETLMICLDALGKWSVIDAYVLIMMMVAFNLDLNLFEQDAVVVRVLVAPDFGFYGFMFATVTSLLMSHVVLGLHRKCEQPFQARWSDDGREALCTCVYDDKQQKQAYSSANAVAVLALLAGTAALVTAGATINSFDFEFQGLIGAILNSRATSNTQEFSVFSLANTVPKIAENPHSLGIILIQYSFLFFTLYAPLLSIAALAVLWTTPMTVYGQKVTLMAAEIFYAWSALDVFVVSIIAALLEIKQFAAFVIGDKCAFLVPIIESMPELMVYVKDNPSCFDVSTHLQEGCWTLFASCIVAHISSQIVLRAARRAIEGRMSTAAQALQAVVVAADGAPVAADEAP
jgi:hypothetical protein